MTIDSTSASSRSRRASRGWPSPTPRSATCAGAKASTTTASTRRSTWPGTARSRTSGTCSSRATCPTTPSARAFAGEVAPLRVVPAGGAGLAADRRGRGRGPARRAAQRPVGRRRGAQDATGPRHRCRRAAPRRPHAGRGHAHAGRGSVPAAARPRPDRSPARPGHRRQPAVDDRRHATLDPEHVSGPRAVPDRHHRPRLQRLDLHRPGHRLHRGRRGRLRGGGHRRAVGPAARRRPQPRPRPARRDRHGRPHRRGGRCPSSSRASASWASAMPSTRARIRGRSCSTRWRATRTGPAWRWPRRSRPGSSSCWPSATPSAICAPTSSSTPAWSWSPAACPSSLFTPAFATSRIVGLGRARPRAGRRHPHPAPERPLHGPRGSRAAPGHRGRRLARNRTPGSSVVGDVDGA